MKVGVIMGGVSSEREVSLKSGRGILGSIDKNKYEVVEVILDSKQDIFEKAKGLDFALLALHGEFGEDGTVQAILEAMDIPYSGCGPLTSGLCMDKNMSKKILKEGNIPTAPWTTVKDLDKIDYDKIEEIGYPLFIKPNSGGSSVATFLIKDKSEIYDAVKEVLKYDKEAMIEKYIKGEEYTSFILNGEVFPTISIKTENEFFDYEAKYSQGGKGAKEEVVYLDKDLQEKVNEVSKKCWDAFNCRVYVRVDVIISEGVPYVLELNTLPGMTATSLIPQSAKARGIEYSELIDKIIEYSLA
ncbi:D-alanine--D-alanine ligase [Romboutsia sp. 1001216sp1]|uniref:D-alanine--D-alanine ligase n=1 Tax=Romboutsia sp. 1001216sp1 TaxID=2986997 RepID=UPI00232B1536|nr:D-alanine--D-alanine ligase [Romboutsia sp. 1001216sp1]MDB8803571.1 D-alanine--D-alanine ligase [Romboutsia sp. 1001216sp1]MDB8807927.1 D-alanine--D-alanine ligase [Romboutsia sp. 1001216sp1]MDB8809219.1 D-alanine--D-alanine ligase [Romboutsia sp. 1001216sp1]MDB8814967.1 D-alanine--D-alanine ligase [Romboutsia sp. 1001216sp1]MDB8819700.1 D-alanine--D-alanine ligase [Romboutsia sp. 1001216sp1]